LLGNFMLAPDLVRGLTKAMPISMDLLDSPT
jgi:hypothetical protein